jgi:hypothetical protein
VAVYITGQDFGCGLRGSNQQIIVNDGMGHLVSQHAFVKIINIEIYGIIFVYIPGPKQR